MYSTQTTSPRPKKISLSRIPLCCPELANSLCNTDIICLERVQRNTQKDGSRAERPHGRITDHGHTLLGEVVNDARLETDVRVDDKKGAEDRVGDGVQRAGGEGGDCEGNETGGDDPRILSALFAAWMLPLVHALLVSHIAGKQIRLYVQPHGTLTCAYSTDATPQLFKLHRTRLPTSQSSSGRIRGCSRGWGLGRAPVTCLR